MWRGFLGGDDGNFDIGETGFFQHFVEVDFGEAKPLVAVKLPRLLEGMRGQVENEDAPAGLKDAEGFAERDRRAWHVVECLAEKREIHFAIGERGSFDVAKPVFEIGDAVFAGDTSSEADHLFAAINGDDPFCLPGQQHGESALSGAEIGNAHGREQAQQRMGQATPGASRDVGFAKFSCELVEVFRRTIRPFSQAKTESGAVGRGLGQGVGGLLDERADEGLTSRRTWAVVTVFAETPVSDQSGTPQEGEVGGYARLTHGEDFLELGDGQFFLFEQ